MTEEHESRLIRFALHRFAVDARARANEAAQDKAGLFFKPGAVAAFLQAASDAESILSRRNPQ